MDNVSLLLESIRKGPTDQLAWLALADGLEEANQPRRAALTRLTRRLLEMPRDEPGRDKLEEQLRGELADGVRPCLPEVTNSVGMRFALIPPGTFWMGSERGERSSDPDEYPLRCVTIPRAFWMSVLPVSVAEYSRVTRRKAWQFNAPGRPAHGVSHVAATRFCARLSKRKAEQSAGRVYRLPTEAEWEYACRAGTTTAFHLGDRITRDLADVAHDFASGPQPPGRFPPNAFGLFDMHGGVYHWCSDWHEENYYAVGPEVAPTGPATGLYRVLRNACWVDREDACRSASRNRARPNDGSVYLGLRACFDLNEG